MAGETIYKNITATVRPPRCAIFINKNSDHWKSVASVAITRASEVWGGQHFLLVPTDGTSIEKKFWEILEAYSPDHLAIANLTFADLEEEQPEQYLEVKRRYEEGWQKAGNQLESFEEWFTGSAQNSLVDELKISDSLQKELIRRLSPFHYHDAIDQHLTSQSGFSYPFTIVTKIISCTTRHIGMVTLPKPLDNPTLALLVHSQTGIGSSQYRKELSDEGFSSAHLPDSHDDRDYLRYIFGGTQRAAIQEGTGQRPADYKRNMPFGLSMLHLGQYYRVDLHQDYKEPVVVVLGDTVHDFCLYYSLSRMHEGVLWLPLAWLRSCNTAFNENVRRNERGEEYLPLTQEQKAARILIDLSNELIQYGHHNKRVQLCSASLTKSQLIAYRTQITRCATGEQERFRSAIDCMPLEEVSISCVVRVYEENNHANYRSTIFVDGQTVSPFDTPKPKNFNEIRLPDHHWLTSIAIEGFHPPSLATLGPKIINIQNSTMESRVATDGIVYNCPSFMHFGGDVDVNTVRPKIRMPDVMEMFNTYFEETGITVQYSDKGNYFVDTLRRFGGLEATGKFIKAASTRGVLDKFMSKKVAEGGNIIYLDNDQRAYLNLGAIAASVGDEKAAADLADDLVGKQVLQRGYIFQCERCRLSSWYGLDGLTAEFTCNRCSLSQQFTRGHWRDPVVPHWYYKLAETIYQFYSNHSDLTAQVLYKLQLESNSAFHYAPEIDLINFSGPGKKREMDVACILDGQIIFGECKTETLKVKDIEKFETLRKKPVKNPGRVIFATTQPVSDEFRAQAGRLPNAEIFTRSDLYDD